MKSSLELRVGVFVTSGVFLLALSIIMLGGDRSLFKSHVRLFVEFSQVQGLAKGSVISLTGVNVGNVASIAFNPSTDKLRVELKIDKTFQERIRAGTKAEIRTQGALGDKYIYLVPGPLTNSPLETGAEMEAMDGGDVLTMISQKGDSIERVFEIINEVHTLMQTVNGDGRSKKVMDNLVQSSSSLKGTMSGMQALLDELRGQGHGGELQKSMKHLSSILRKIDQGEGTLGALINDPTLHENLKAALGGSPRQKYLKSLARESIQATEKK